jgi:7-cyano-7-deazaguanine reductase
MPDVQILKCFENPAPERDYVIEHVAEEFTSVCPNTGHPDFAIFTLRYCPDRLAVELKSLKLYYQSYRNEGIYYEAVTNQIAEHLGELMKPRWLALQSEWTGRGGIRSRITVTEGDVPIEHL